MAGPFAKLMVQLVAATGQTVIKSFMQAYRAQAAGGGGAKQAAAAATSFGRTRIKMDEARKVLNLGEHDTRAEMRRRYDLLFKANEGADGSFYLQSKIFRSKERLDEHFDEVEGPLEEEEEGEEKKEELLESEEGKEQEKEQQADGEEAKPKP